MRSARHALLLAIVCQVPVTGHAEALQTVDLPGTWVYSSTDGHEGMTECPDFIVFGAGDAYRIENECAAADPGDPVVESGTWQLEESPEGRFILLRDRKTMRQHDVLRARDAPRLRLMAVSKETLRVETCPVAGNDTGCRVDTYRRWAPGRD